MKHWQESNLHQRCPNGSRSHGVASDPLVTNNLVTECPHETDHSSLRWCVVNKLRMTYSKIDGCVEGDCRTLLHNRDDSLWQMIRIQSTSSRESDTNFSDVEKGMNVCVKRVMPLLWWQGRQVCISILSAMIENSGNTIVTAVRYT